MLQFNPDYRFVEGIFLLKLTTPTCPSLIAMTKGIDNLSEDIKNLEFCTPTSKSEFENSCAFVFNNGDIFYYTLFFHQTQGSFELVIKSYQRCVYFFLNFLKDVLSAFYEIQSAYEPNNVFQLASSLISSWPTTPQNEMDVLYTKSLVTVDFTNADFAYSHYRPSYFFQPKSYRSLFASLISLKPILIVAPDAVRGCRACFCLFCLLYPLRYAERFVLWLRRDDPRYGEILAAEARSPYLVVATDDASEIGCKFDVVVECAEMCRVNTRADTEFQAGVMKVLLTVQAELTSLNNRNPYSDVLNTPWAGAYIADACARHAFMPSFESLSAFERSRTAEMWRLRRARTRVRDVLLQCGDVKFDEFDTSQLERVRAFLLSVRKEYGDDKQVNQVIKKHLAAVSGILERSGAVSK